jgi:hypothetical protein
MPQPDIIEAPWSPGQIDSLNAYQESGRLHPFTCRDDMCRVRDRSPLVATRDGWTHPCGYTQRWALRFMTDWAWRDGNQFDAMDALMSALSPMPTEILAVTDTSQLEDDPW